MSPSKLKPTGWYYILALLIPVIACAGTAALVSRNIPKLPGALEATGIHHLTQVVVPGSAEIAFPKAGAYAVYYEYRSVIDGVNYVRDKYPPSISCLLKSKANGKEMAVVNDYIEGNTYATKNNQRVGVLIKSISIEKPGLYSFSCQYPGSKTGPKIVLAVGPNIIWELFNVAAKPVAAILCGAFVFIVGLAIAILITGLVAFKRHQAKKTLAPQA